MMTLANPQSTVTYQGNGAATSFPFPFLVQQASHLVVTLTDNTQSPVVITQLSSSQYSANGFGVTAGGTVTLLTALAVGLALTIQRVVPYLQSTSIINQGGFYPDVLEAALDYLTMEVQQLAEQSSRTVLVPVGSGLDPSSFLVSVQSSKTAAASSASSASTSASSASTFATSAASSATSASASAASAAASAASASIGALTTAQFAALTTTVIAALTTTSAQALASTLPVASLVTSQIAGLTSHLLGSTQIASLTSTVMAAWTSTAVAAFTSTALGGLKSSVIPSTAISGLGSIGMPLIIGSIRNGKMSVTAASSTGTFTADELIVETALGGTAYKIASYSQTVNLATTGAGGMDTGSPPANSFVSLYAIYNPTTTTASILACAVAISSGAVYSGANMPTGYTASALLTTVPTNASSQFPILYAYNGKVSYPKVNALNITASVPTTWTSVGLSNSVGMVPATAISISGSAGDPTAAQNGAVALASDANGTNELDIAIAGTSSGIGSFLTGAPFSDLPLITAQTLYYKSTNASYGVRIDISAYRIY
jgi:hypothetical protein